VDIPDNLDIDEDVLAVLAQLRTSSPGLFAGLLAAFNVISLWIPERPAEPTIRRWAELWNSGFRVWRFKNKETLGDWRIFFFLLDAARPPAAIVAAVIEFSSQDETYDDPASPHALRIRKIYLQYQTEGLIKR
jgi:hypothetical protein